MDNSQYNFQKTLNSDPAPLVRSNYYECEFCKKGFNNPQALGGHMNMHRKDRAKSSCQTDPTVVAIVSAPSASENPNMEKYAYSCHGNYSYYAAGDYSGAGSNGVCERPKELNLFWKEERESGGDQGKEVDLELRLGYQP